MGALNTFVRFAPMFVQHDHIVIVASGPSARGYEPPEGVTVIAVNGAIEWLSRADYWFTLDPSRDNLRRLAGYWAKVKCVMAVPANFGTSSAKTPLMRQPRPLGVHYLLRVEGPGPWGARYRLSEDPTAINTGNSAWGALGLAYHMRPYTIELVGVDGTQARRVGGGQPGDLTHLPELFASAEAQLAERGITVIVRNPRLVTMR